MDDRMVARMQRSVIRGGINEAVRNFRIAFHSIRATWAIFPALFEEGGNHSIGAFNAKATPK